VRDGTTGQKQLATSALRIVALDNADNREVIKAVGGIEILVALARDGTDAQKLEAAGALRNLALDDSNKVDIPAAGGIEALVALASEGTERQKTEAAGALGNLALNFANRVLIAVHGGVPPLVAIARRRGHGASDELADWCLGLMESNFDNKVQIAKAGHRVRWQGDRSTGDPRPLG